MALGSTDQVYVDTSHLLRRAGFGGSPEVIAAAADRGIAATTETLIDYESTPDPIDDDYVVERIEEIIPENAKQALQNRLPVLVVQSWWVYRMLASPRPLQEKMVLFWANHFTSTDNNGTPLYYQNQLFRSNALGNFRTLTLEVSKNPEMLRYLNGDLNVKAHPNENYARELMEIFTCGRVGPDGKPNYTESDVKASARAFSGWNTRRGVFSYRPNQHDESVKTFMGHTGDLNGDDIVDILVSLPATGYYMCRKLFRHFAYDDPEPGILDTLVQTYFDSGYEIRPVVRQILTSDAFYSAKARGALIKSPVDYVIGTVNALGLTPAFAPPASELFGDGPYSSMPFSQSSRALESQAGQASSPQPLRRALALVGSPIGRLIFLVGQIRNMGQDLLVPPSVKGWDGGEAWINTDTLQARVRFDNAIANLPVMMESDLWANLTKAYDAGPQYASNSSGEGLDARLIDVICTQLGGIELTDPVRSALLEYASGETDIRVCARGLLALILATPEYQCG
jgi:uncharacterized protein (DUF1800 family)